MTKAVNILEMFVMDESQMVPLMISSWKPFVTWVMKIAILRKAYSA